MPSETQFTVNMPHEARRIWDFRKRGHTHTRIAMAGIAAWATLDQATQDELMMLVASVSEQGLPWSDVLDWADARRESAAAEVILSKADDTGRQPAKPKTLRKTAAERK